MLRTGDNRALEAAVLAFKRGDRALKSTMNKETRTRMTPVWKSLVESKAAARGGTSAVVLGKGARIKAGLPPVAVAATSGRKMRGGLTPRDDWHAFEFGGQRSKETTYTRRSPKGTTHQVTRHTSRQLPGRTKQGWVVYPAVAEITPRMVSMWIFIIAETYRNAAESR